MDFIKLYWFQYKLITYTVDVHVTCSQAMHLSLGFPFQGLGELNAFIPKALALYPPEVWFNLAFKYKHHFFREI